ncbi:hypothetical protein [Spirosoma daeguense]
MIRSFVLFFISFLLVDLPTQAQTDRKTAFTAHLLTTLVDPGKKHEYELLIGGQKVSLHFPIRCRTQSLWQ